MFGTGAAPNWKEEAKLLVEAKKLKECTFQPNIHRAAKGEEAKDKQISVNTTERLYGMRKAQIDKTDKTKEDYELERSSNECTFQPKFLSQESSSRVKQPLVTTTRQSDSMQKQIERQNKAREEKERLKTFTERGITVSSQPTATRKS